MGTVFRQAVEIVKTLKCHGFSAYFAGGYVRDLLLGNQSFDIDIATNALPKQVANIFPEHILVGAQFGVCIVRVKGHQFEIATFRQDIDYLDGRRPKEIDLKATPAEDAKRRDFTINGMFFDPETKEVLDFVEGQNDIKKKIIRTIGDPHERFKEDRLRMIRAIRFARRFDFSLEDETKKAIQKLSHTLLPSVSMERIWQEFVKMRMHPRFTDALVDMAELGLLGTIFPPLKETPPKELQKRLSGMHEVSEKVPPILFLSQLFSEQDLPYVLGLAIYLRASKQETKQIEHFLELKTLYRSDPDFINRYEWAYLLASSKAESSLETLVSKLDSRVRNKSKKQLETLIEELSFHIECIKKNKPLCVAKDLEPFGIRPGRRMGLLLEQAERLAIMENITDKTAILERLKTDPMFLTTHDDR